MNKITPYKTVLDANTAYWMARISKEIYLKKSDGNQIPDEEKILKNLKNNDLKFISVFGVDKNSAQAAVIEHEDYICIVFRGTNELKDWLDNLNAFAKKELFGEFHRGFWNSVEDVWKPIEARCRELQGRRKRPVFFTGHSLGGAMATIAAAKFIHEDKPFTSAYTFGQPRVLTRETARIFNSECKARFFRFHNNNDIVTRVPARLMGYSHIGSYLYISEELTIHKDPGYWFKFVDHFDGAFNALLERGIDGVEDHDMAKYLKAVERWDLE
ncbi:lipase family protein [Desulforhopalus singaporensis]|uniref:Lipase (Class 3) n=1 Tax=Desulforhopalus singaporensis TaxID=91360 RepID=A0A1H0W0K7_9BACT|nr:lipase family protein [Desulforhopalus singaporensis]SDP84234.1 Lipase (class 3) [Desulforhopalus singaporensis]